MSFLLHLVSNHRSIVSIKEEQVDIIFPRTYEKHCVGGISDIYWYIPKDPWKALRGRYQWYLLNVAEILFLMQKARRHYLEITRFSHVTFRFRHVTFIFCIVLDILDDIWKFLLLFLITLTIPLLSPRKYGYTTFPTSEKIKKILSWWKKVFFSDSFHVTLEIWSWN